MKKSTTITVPLITLKKGDKFRLDSKFSFTPTNIIFIVEKVFDGVENVYGDFVGARCSVKQPIGYYPMQHFNFGGELPVIPI